MINYNFKHLKNVPVQYMSNSQVAKAIELDALITPVRGIQEKYGMGSIVSQVVRTNQDAINLINRSTSKNDLYPEANRYEGDDNDLLDRLNNKMDEAGDEAHDEDFEEKPSFANNTPENRWRDLRQLSDSVFNADEMEEIVNRKKKGKVVSHKPQKIENQILEWLNVSLTREESSNIGDVIGDRDSQEEDQASQTLILLVLVAVVLLGVR